MTNITAKVAEALIADLIRPAAGSVPIFCGRDRQELETDTFIAVTAEGMTPDGLTAASVPIAVTVCAPADATGIALADAIEAAIALADLAGLRALAQTAYNAPHIVRGHELTAPREDDFAEAGRIVSSLTLTLSLAHCLA